MPNLLSNYVGGSKPKLITLLTSGTGTYVPTADMARCLVRIQAGGAGGYSSGNYAGGGGAMTEVLIRIPIAGLSYTVGAGGAVGSDGSMSTFGPFASMPGICNTSPNAGLGGIVGALVGPVDADGATITLSGLSGVSGGFGGYGSAAGGLAGFPVDPSTSTNYSGQVPLPYITAWQTNYRNGQGNASGGNSFYGKGGTTGNSPASDAYGAGGGYNAAGRAGCIEIWDFGA